MTLLNKCALRRLAPSRLFSDIPEESQRLRVLTLTTAVWVALSLNWLTGSLWIPSIAIGLACVGHWASWRWRRHSLRYRSIAIALSIVGLSLAVIFIATPAGLASALTADRLPIAEYIMLVSGIASFGLRTRGGLYAQLTLSGIVLFFVGERAFDPTFVVFLIVFLGLFLTIFAIAFVEDQLSIAQAHWPGGQLGRIWFWLVPVGGGLLVCSTLAFSLLPADLRGHLGSQRVGIMPFMGEGGELEATAMAPLGPGSQGQDAPNATLIDEATGSGDHDPGGLGALTAEPFEGRSVATDPRDMVMHVRSKVTSYWRGRLFDQFDGQTWFRSRDPLVELPLFRYKNFYWQAFFVEQDQPGSLFGGYNPVRLLLSSDLRDSVSLSAGSTYSVLSQQPTLESHSLRAEGAGQPGDQYLLLPPESEGLQHVAREIVGVESWPFQQLWLIVSYLRQHHSYSATAPNQLQLSGSVDDFLAGGTSGTSLDFATATVLLARAVGLPARLAVGYLPGKFERFSGTHEVRIRDAHAWAEVNFARHGWVAFDGTPRPELDVFTSGDLSGFTGATFIFQTRVGGGLYSFLHSGASRVMRGTANLLEGRGGLIGPTSAVVAVLCLGLATFWILQVRSRGKKQEWRYSRLPGEGRRQILQAHRRMQRLLRKQGLQTRRSSQTLREYAESAARHFGDPPPELEWFTEAGWVAAYDPVGPGHALVREAAERLSRVRHGRTCTPGT